MDMRIVNIDLDKEYYDKLIHFVDSNEFDYSMEFDIWHICQKCGSNYDTDVMVHDNIWKEISPKKVDGFKSGGLLCPQCIVNALQEKYALALKLFVQ